MMYNAAGQRKIKKKNYTVKLKGYKARKRERTDKHLNCVGNGN